MIVLSMQPIYMVIKYMMPISNGNLSKIIRWGSVELFFIVSVISTIMFGIFSAAVVSEMKLSQAMLGWLSGVFFIVYAFTQLYSGRLFTQFSSRLILCTSAVIAGIGAIIFADTNNIVCMFIARILLGAGLASTFVGVLYIVQVNFSPYSFPVMSSLSQTLANIGSGVFGCLAEFVVIHYNYRCCFYALGIALLICAIFMLFCLNDRQGQITIDMSDEGTFLTRLKIIIQLPQVWYATFYFFGLFGAMLTFADLFGVEYQMKSFHIAFATATILNAMIPFGLAFGCVIAGLWTQRIHNYVLPARVFALCAVITFIMILSLRLNSLFVIAIIYFMFGIGCSGSILSFQCIQRQVYNLRLRPLATSFVLTTSYLLSGLVQQPIVGSLITNVSNQRVEHPIEYKWLFDFAVHDEWYKYNSGLCFILIFIVVSFVVSLLFKNGEINEKL